MTRAPNACAPMARAPVARAPVARAAAPAAGWLAAVALVVGLLIGLSETPVGAQTLGSSPTPVPMPPSASAPRTAEQPGDIGETGLLLARAWAAGDVDQLARLLSRQGIHLRLGGLDRASLSARLAEAALRDFFRSFEQGSVQLVRTASLAGQPQRGFAEFRWQTRAPGTSNAQTQFIFMGLSLEDGGWRVNEVRLLP
jgi:hypothetical protein